MAAWALPRVGSPRLLPALRLPGSRSLAGRAVVLSLDVFVPSALPSLLASSTSHKYSHRGLKALLFKFDMLEDSTLWCEER